MVAAAAAACRGCCQTLRLPDTHSRAILHQKNAGNAALTPSQRTYRTSSCHCMPRAPSPPSFPRRSLLESALGLGLAVASPSLLAAPASANSFSGFALHTDTFDGYSFNYPRTWIQVRGAGADVFFRDPVHLDENVSVEISSPSSSRFKEVRDLGSPDQAAQKVLKQYLTEFMSTRLGVRRESKIVSASSKVSDDGKEYYEVQVNVRSYANNQQLAVMPQDRVPKLEWDRRYLSVLGVENNRLYELRLQVPEYVLSKEQAELQRIMDSFRVFKV